MIYFILINGLNLYLRRDWAKSIYWNPVTKLLKLDQRWNMFQNPGLFADGWIDLEINPTLEKRNRLFHSKAFQEQTFYQHRWVKLMMNAALGEVVVQKGPYSSLLRAKETLPQPKSQPCFLSN